MKNANKIQLHKNTPARVCLEGELWVGGNDASGCVHTNKKYNYIHIYF